MKCLKCGKEVGDKVRVCPYCSHVFSDAEFDLPVLKKEEVSLEKTRAISPVRDEEDFSLIDDINEEIEKSANQTPDVRIGDNVDITSNTANSILNSDDSLKKRKTILSLCAVFTIVAIILTTVIISINREKTVGTAQDADYMESYQKALEKFYETEDIDDVVFVLERYKTDDKVISKIQSKTRITCDSWLLNYVSEKVTSKTEFEELTKKYENFLFGLNNYAVVKNEEKEIKALPDGDYLELSNRLQTIYDDSIVFFDALTLYNAKDYNKAYSTFDKIDSNNTYYERGQYYLTKIIENVLDILKEDIKKLENGIDRLSTDEKLTRYARIEEIILGYDAAYFELNLSKDSGYKNILEEYRNKIIELTDMPSDLEEE